ncbi:MAG: hypothetical protein KAI69_08610 [Deltaproteobacteria bacterium]|nr:hypothetical protein [Deltaproteobacteria bacterium]
MKCFNYGVVLGLVMLFMGSSVGADNSFIDLISSTKIYFSHIATTDGWQTEVAVLNPTASTASGTLTPYNADGYPVSQEIRINLPAHGRYQLEVGSAFSAAWNIAYIVLTSETFGLKGYSKFYTGGVRASIMASGPKTDGLFTKIDHAGWTGIAFINVSAVIANITLTAYSDAGEDVAVKTMQVLPGVKIVNSVRQIFGSVPPTGTYVNYHSDQAVVGFFLNGSGDGSMLDGSQAL